MKKPHPSEFVSDGDIYDRLRLYIQEKDIEADESYLKAPNYYGLYYKIGQLVKPDTILEFGIRYGYSAIAMLLGAGHPTDYFGYDSECYEHNSNVIAGKSIRMVSNAMTFIHTVDTQDLARIDLASEFSIDLVHLDGSHTLEGIVHDLDLVTHVIHQGSYILVDDVSHAAHPVLYETIKKWADNARFDCYDVDSFCGMLVLKRSNDVCKA